MKPFKCKICNSIPIVKNCEKDNWSFTCHCGKKREVFITERKTKEAAIITFNSLYNVLFKNS